MRSLEVAAGLTLALLSACGDQSGMSPAPLQIAGFSGIPTMNPGQDCMSCHIGSGNAHRRIWTVAGTVFSDPGALVDAGVDGAEVLITDNNHQQITLVTNQAGNFYTGEDLAFPLLDVQIQRGKRRLRMNLSVQAAAGNCNSCHAQPALNGAMGRLFVPID
jgi:hypothetical protein